MNNVDWQTQYESLVRRLTDDDGIDPKRTGHLTREQKESFKDTDGYNCGWNDAIMACIDHESEIVEKAREVLSEETTMLLASDMAFLHSDGTISLNMNDTWGWALAWAAPVAADQLDEVARLFRRYGRAGLMYWHSKQEDDMRSEFADINRMIDFVKHEEALCAEEPSSSKRAYKKISYTLGE